MDIYKKRRQRVQQMLSHGECLLIRANTFQIKSNDVEYEFRQDSNFHYLTGFHESDAILLITGGGEGKEVIFVQEKNPQMELWTGVRLGVEKAKDVFDVDFAYGIGDFEKEIIHYLEGQHKVYFQTESGEIRKQFFKVFDRLPFFRKKIHPTEFASSTVFLSRLRHFKDAGEIKLMRKAQDISIAAHKELMAFTQVGDYEYDLEAILKYIFTLSEKSDLAYGAIVAAGNNANCLHYISNNSKINDDDLILVDSGCEYNLYAADITRTYPANGKFTSAQKDVYEIVLAALDKAQAMARPGTTLTQLHQVACEVLTQGLIDLKILSGSLEQNLDELTYREFYPHGTSHWLGLDVHDVGPYKDVAGMDIKLAPGMCFTIEPGLYFNALNENIDERFRSIGIRIEDDILITENGHENLSAGLGRSVQEVEDLCQQASELRKSRDYFRNAIGLM